MDKLDIYILRELTQAQTIFPAKPGLKSPCREIARKLAVSSGTIRNRINKMYASGTLRGSSVYPNPNLLGLGVGAYAVEVTHSLTKKQVLEELKLVKGILFIQNFHGNLLGIAFVFENEESRLKKLDEFNIITGVQDGTFSRVHYPECKTFLSMSEWKLVHRLSQESFRNYDQLAKYFGISVRTLKRRMSKIVAARAVLSVPNMDYRAIEGVPTDLIISFTDPQARVDAENQIMQLIKDLMIFAGVWEDFGMYSLILPKVITATELHEKITQIPGVAAARIEFVDEHIDQAKNMLSYVEVQLERTGEDKSVSRMPPA